MPREGTEVGGNEGNPKKQAGEADVLRGAVVADVGTAEAETKEGLSYEDEPGELEDGGFAGEPAGKAEGKQKKDGDDDEGGFELAGAGGAAGIWVDGWVEVWTTGDV